MSHLSPSTTSVKMAPGWSWYKGRRQATQRKHQALHVVASRVSASTAGYPWPFLVQLLDQILSRQQSPSQVLSKDITHKTWQLLYYAACYHGHAVVAPTTWCRAPLPHTSLCNCRWADLPTVDADTAAKAAQLRTQLTGDSAHQYSTEEATGQQAAEEDAGDGSKAVVTEVQRLRCMIDNINAATAVLPKVCAAAGCVSVACSNPSLPNHCEACATAAKSSPAGIL
jgi:hypothetical protein